MIHILIASKRLLTKNFTKVTKDYRGALDEAAPGQGELRAPWVCLARVYINGCFRK